MIRPRAETIVKDYSLALLADGSLLAELDRIVTHGRLQDARLVACIAEVDARRSYLPQGYPSMFAFCVGRLRLSEDAAYKRIQAGRAARRFPALFEAIADGRLHLTAVVKLAPHLTPTNIEELMVAATHRSKLELEHLLAERFPQPDLANMLRALPAAGDSGVSCRLVPEPVGSNAMPAPSAPLQERVRAALRQLAPPSSRVTAAPA